MKRPLNLEEIAEALKGRLQGPGGAFTGISTDSRSIAPGDLFFALRGPNFDGHRFIKDVFDKGASGAVVEGSVNAVAVSGSFNLIKVEDTLSALGSYGSYIRGLYKIPFVAVSGSAGKTTTKEMIASILGRSRRVLKTEGNRNNLIGLPLTLSGLDAGHEAAVVELGISEPGEMERLSGMARPDVAVITNIGRGHLKSLGTLEGVANAKGALFRGLGPHGVKVVNLDDPWVVRAAGPNGTSVRYGLKGGDVRIISSHLSPALDSIDVAYEVRGSLLQVRFATPGAANAVNGAAAIAATLALGVPLSEMREGLETFTPVKGRMSLLKTGGVYILDDTYNANPESMGAALKTLAASKGRKVAILGEMLELGEASSVEHEGVGALAAGLGIDIVVAVGPSSADTAKGAIRGGLEGPSVLAFKEKKEAIEALKTVLKEGDSVLVKASRGARLEDIVEGLKAHLVA